MLGAGGLVLGEGEEGVGGLNAGERGERGLARGGRAVGAGEFLERGLLFLQVVGLLREQELGEFGEDAGAFLRVEAFEGGEDFGGGIGLVDFCKGGNGVFANFRRELGAAENGLEDGGELGMRGLAIDEEELLVGEAPELVGDDAGVLVEEDDGLLDLAVGGFFSLVVLRAGGRSGGEQEAGGEEEETWEQGRAACEIVLHGGRNIRAAKRGCQWQKGEGTTETRWTQRADECAIYAERDRSSGFGVR